MDRSKAIDRLAKHLKNEGDAEDEMEILCRLFSEIFFERTGRKVIFHLEFPDREVLHPIRMPRPDILRNPEHPNSANLPETLMSLEIAAMQFSGVMKSYLGLLSSSETEKERLIRHRAGCETIRKKSPMVFKDRPACLRAILDFCNGQPIPAVLVSEIIPWARPDEISHLSSKEGMEDARLSLNAILNS